MKRLEELLAFPLYASVAWLVWVLSQQAGPTGVAVMVRGTSGAATGGAVVTSIGPGDFGDIADRVLVQVDDRILLFGSSNNRLVLARYLGDDVSAARQTIASSAEASTYDAAIAALYVEDDVPLGRRRK